MTMLTPSERAETVRFGIHDLDVLAAMEENADDIVLCARCEGESTFVLVCRGTCTTQRTACKPCLTWVRRETRKMQLRCHHCRFEAPGTGLDSCVKVIEL